jgi:two-component system nitrate/nitrite response regulator NarL
VRKSMSTIIVGEHTLLREGLASLLLHTPYKVIAAAAKTSELKDVRVPPGVRTLVILQIDGPGGNVEEPSESIRLLRSLFCDCKIVVVAETSGPVDMQRIMACAPDGYILNLRSGVILVKLLELTLMDQQFLALPRPAPLRASSRPKSHDHEDAANLGDASDTRHGRNGSPLSQREQQILTHLVRGNSNKAIARLCNITESTVKVHLKAILRKTDSRNRTQAAIWAVANGFANEEAVVSPSLDVEPLTARSQEPLPGSRTNGSLPRLPDNVPP